MKLLSDSTFVFLSKIPMPLETALNLVNRFRTRNKGCSSSTSCKSWRTFECIGSGRLSSSAIFVGLRDLSDKALALDDGVGMEGASSSTLFRLLKGRGVSSGSVLSLAFSSKISIPWLKLGRLSLFCGAPLFRGLPSSLMSCIWWCLTESGWLDSGEEAFLRFRRL